MDGNRRTPRGGWVTEGGRPHRTPVAIASAPPAPPDADPLQCAHPQRVPPTVGSTAAAAAAAAPHSSGRGPAGEGRRGGRVHPIPPSPLLSPPPRHPQARPCRWGVNATPVAAGKSAAVMAAALRRQGRPRGRGTSHWGRGRCWDPPFFCTGRGRAHRGGRPHPRQRRRPVARHGPDLRRIAYNGVVTRTLAGCSDRDAAGAPATAHAAAAAVSLTSLADGPTATRKKE